MKTKLTYAWMVVLLFALGYGTAWSQTTRVRGKITSGGKPVPNAQVVLTSTTTGKVYKLKADKDGQFVSIGIAIDQYNMEVDSATGEKLYEQTISVAGKEGEQDLSADVGEGIKVSKEIERIKAENAKATSINVLIRQYTEAISAKDLSDKTYQTASTPLKGKQDQASADELKKLTDQHDADVQKAWTDAETAAQQMVAADPKRWEYFQALGGVKNNLKKYQEAVDNYEKGIQLAEAAAAGNAPKSGGNAPDPAKAKAAIGQMLGGEGNAYLKLSKPKEAIEAFTKAAERDPNPGTAYFNLCATQYNTGNTEGALAACDKAIAADPTRAEAYFIKGSLMMGASTMDKQGKLQAPAGTAEALNKYLEIAPTGSHVNDVKEMLAAIGAKIETTYSGKKKK
jgi:tetratricopeptide (TPR) repeat protein